MSSPKRGTRAHGRAVVLALGAVAIAALTGSSASAAGGSSGGLSSTAPARCGQNIVFNHSGSAYDSLSANAKQLYANYNYPVHSTPWSTFKGKKGPWKIGFISVPINNPWEISNYNQIKHDFAAAKAKGLVTGSLQTYIQTSGSSATPEQQDAAISQMVRSGVDGIIIHADDANAEAPAIDAAGKAGVPVVEDDDVSTTSKYSINFFTQNNSPTYAQTLGRMQKSGLIGQGKAVDVLMVRGIPGFAVEQGYYHDALADLKPCPGINIVGTVWGQWNSATAKTQILSFLASHPQPVNLVLQSAVGPGVIEAFQEAGRKLPIMNFGGTAGGELSYWATHKSEFPDSVAGLNGGFQTAYDEFRILLRVLGGHRLKVNGVSVNSVMATSANVSQFAYPGKPLTWLGDVRGPADALASNSELNLFFKTPGTPGNL